MMLCRMLQSPIMLMRRILLSLAVWTGIVCVTALCSFLAPIVFLVVPAATGTALPLLARWCVWSYGRAVSWMLGLFFPLHLEGVCGEKKESPRIYVFNHASLFDLFLITQVVPPDCICLARQWPFSVPVFGPVMRLGGYINTEKCFGEEVLRKARTLLEHKTSVAVFPEGTRSRTREMSRFRSGAFKLSILAGVPVTPVTIEGTGRILPPGAFLMRPGRIRLRALNDVFPAPYIDESLGHAAMRRFTHERIQACVSATATL